MENIATLNTSNEGKSNKIFGVIFEFLIINWIRSYSWKIKNFCDLRKNSNINEIAYYKIRKNKNTDINNFYI